MQSEPMPGETPGVDGSWMSRLVSRGNLQTPVWMVMVGAVVAGVWWGAPEQSVVAGTGVVEVTATTPRSRITVHVAGWVARPGLVELPALSRVADAVAAAGGVRPGASLGGLNLAAEVGDGEMVVVPGPGEATDGSEGGGGPAGGLIDVNRADAAILETLPGVGPVLAERIVAYREEHGRFETIEDLLDVSGVGERKLESLRPYLKNP